MRVERVHIYGFGKWVDTKIDFTADNFMCVFGENESGKSTLQQFIIFMFFGLPPRKREFFRSKKSGQMGGRLVIHDETTGRFTIERMDEVNNGAARCYQAGKEFDEQWLREQLNHLTEEVYHSIYSFSSADLQQMININDEDVGKLLLEVSLTGAKHIQAIENRLEQSMGDLFKPYGKIPKINQQLSKMEELQKQLEKSQTKETAYYQTRQQLLEKEEDIQSIQQQLAKKQKRILQIEKILQALPFIHKYQQFKHKLATLPEEIHFPQQGMERWQQLQDQLLPLQSKKKVLADHLQEVNSQLQETKQKLFSEEHLAKAKEMVTEWASNKEGFQQKVQWQQRITEAEQKIETGINDLNIALSKEQLKDLTFPFYTEQTWNELSDQMKTIHYEQEQLEKEKQTYHKQKLFLAEESERVKADLLTEEQARMYKQKVEAHTSQKYVQQNGTSGEENKQSIKQLQQRNTFILGGSIGLFLIFLVLASVLDPMIFYLLATISLVFGGAQWLLGRNMLKQMEQLTRERESTRISTLTDEEASELQNLLNIHEQAKNRQLTIQEQKKQVAIEIIKWDEKKNGVAQQYRRLEKRMQEQEEQFQFLAQIEVNYWPDLYDQLKKWLEKWRIYEDNKVKYREIEQKQKRISKALQQVAADLNIEERQISTEQLFERITQVLEQQTTEKIKYEQGIKRKRVMQRELKELDSHIQFYKSECKKLFRKAQVTEEGHFYEVYEMWTEKNEIKQEISNLYEQLSVILPPEIINEQLKAELSQMDLTHREQEEREKLHELEEMLEEKRQKRADIRAALQQLESSEDYSESLHQYEMEKQHLQALALEWSVEKFAQAMLEETKTAYQQRYLQAVIKKTSSYFKQLTKGAYRQVYAPTEENLFRVETVDGLLYQVNELSTGTIHQLYVSLRMAVSDLMSEKYQLPFLIDDAFLNFDAIRLEEMLNILQSVAKRQQVILFTCQMSMKNQKLTRVIDLHDKRK